MDTDESLFTEDEDAVDHAELGANIDSPLNIGMW